MPHFALLLLLLTKATLIGCSSEPVESIRLEEFTRGTQRSIEINSRQTTVRLNDTEETKKTDAKVWQKLLQLTQKLPPEKLDKVPILSKKHQVDAALAATLAVVTPDTTYISPTFDHNAPPDEFREIVDCLYRQVSGSIAESFGQ